MNGNNTFTLISLEEGALSELAVYPQICSMIDGYDHGRQESISKIKTHSGLPSVIPDAHSFLLERKAKFVDYYSTPYRGNGFLFSTQCYELIAQFNMCFEALPVPASIYHPAKRKQKVFDNYIFLIYSTRIKRDIVYQKSDFILETPSYSNNYIPLKLSSYEEWYTNVRMEAGFCYFTKLCLPIRYKDGDLFVLFFEDRPHGLLISPRLADEIKNHNFLVDLKETGYECYSDGEYFYIEDKILQQKYTHFLEKNSVS